jgi:aminoglycoside phosphotransferase family enzyme
MVRLPASATLEHAIRSRSVTEPNIRNLARRLSRFYREAPVIECGEDEYRQRFATEIETDRRVLLDPRFWLSLTMIEQTAARLQRFLLDHGGVLDGRVDARRIVDGHGDLRPEHIYFLEDRIVVIDRLEFNAALRQIDPIEELAYLAVECDRGGMPEIGPWLIETHVKETADKPPQGLFSFYKAERAFLRAKLSAWHLDEPGARSAEYWRAQAGSYLVLANDYAVHI